MVKQLVLLLKITPKPEFYENLKAAILEIVPKAIKEPGVRVFTLHEALVENDKNLYLYEIFDSQDAYNSYLEQSYTQAIKPYFKEWIARPVEVIKLSKVS
jgi:quinol monooxygenase YgiN